MYKLLVKGINLILHILAISLLIYLSLSFIQWYLGKVPALGIDLYNSVTHATSHLKSFSFPFNSYKDFWYTGYPVMQDFPQLSYYAMVPFVSYFGGPVGVQVFASVSFVLLLIFSYLLFYELSKNIGLSLFLASLIILSANSYGALTWAGSIPYFASQCIFPLGLYFGVKYLKTPNIVNLCAVALVTGIGILLHPLAMFTYLIPCVLLLVFFGGIGGRFKILRILRELFIYITGLILVSFTYTYSFFYAVLIDRIKPPTIQTSNSGEVKQIDAGAQAIIDFYKGQVSRLYTDTDERLFYILAISFVLFIVGIILARKRKQALFVFPIILIAVYTAMHPVLNLTGVISILKHDPYRAFWQFPIALGTISAALFGFFQTGLYERVGKRLEFLVAVSFFKLTVIFIFLSFFIFSTTINSVLDRVDKISDTSSAFPEVLSMKLNRKDQKNLKDHLLPSFMDSNEKNKRLYASDATLGIWWNSFYDIPLARGYIDPPIGTDRRGGFFLLDTSISNDTLVRDLKFPEDLAKNYSLFFIDWYGIYYFEGGHVSPASNAPPSSYLLEDNIFDKKEIVTTKGAIWRFQTTSGRPQARFDLPQSLIYYRINESYTSPVAYGTNAPSIAVFSDDPGFEQVWRGLAMKNINSRQLIPVHAGRSIDEFKKQDLLKFDAVILHNYKYKDKNRVFGMLDEYIKAGGKVFIDTGGEIADSNSDSLPDFFPFDKSERNELKKDWALEKTSDTLLDDIDFTLFGPPVFNDNPWKFSYPTPGSVLKDGAKIILTNHGKPILITRDYGEGKVIWSGMNLLYHMNQYPIIEEGNLFGNIISQIVTLSGGEIVPMDVNWNSAERVRLETSTRPKAVLFKEQFYKGWSAKDAKTGNQKIYKTGPTFPGFMYVPLDRNDKVTDILFSYNGDLLYWVVTFISLASSIMILELILFRGKILGVKAHKVYHKTRKRVGTWWQKEDEI